MGLSRFGGRVRGSQAVSAWLRGGGSGLRSIQRGTITLTGAALTNTATITAVVTANTVLECVGITNSAGSAADYRDNWAHLALTNATTITATRLTALDGTVSVIVAYEVREYYPGVIKSVQRGTITNPGTATISAVVPSKSSVSNLGTASDAASAYSSIVASLARLTLTNATTVTADSGGSNFTVGYQVVEWY